jgi:hypothetical protein
MARFSFHMAKKSDFVVQKYGGTSVGTADRMIQVADIVKRFGIFDIPTNLFYIEMIESIVLLDIQQMTDKESLWFCLP